MFKSKFFTSKKKKQANADTLTSEGVAFMHAQNYTSAIATFTKVLHNITTNYEYYTNRAKAYLLNNNLDLCLQDCEMSLSLKENTKAYFIKAKRYLLLKQYDEAIICCEKGEKISLHISLHVMNSNEAKEAKEVKEIQEIQSLFVTVKEEKKKYEAELYKIKGDEIMLSKHDFKLAIEAYTKAIHCIPDNTAYLNRRALAYLLDGDNEFVIYDCDKSLTIQPNGKAYGRKAAALCELGRMDEAMGCIEKALEILPDNQELIKTQKMILEKVEAANSFKESLGRDFASMASTCTLALKFAKKGYVHYNNRAIAHLGAGELDKAIEDCKAALKIKDNMKSYRNLALIYCEQKNLVEAFSHIDIALKMSPMDGQALDVRRKLERIQHGIDKEIAMTKEFQIKEETELLNTQVNARIVRLEKKKIRLEKQAIRVRTNYSKLFGNKMVKKGLTKFITAYADLRAFYFSEELNLLRNQRRARGTRTIAKQENDLLKQQVYARARRQKPPPNTIMSNFFKFELGDDHTAKDVEILDKRLNIAPLDRDDEVPKPKYEKVFNLSQKILKKLKKDWPKLPFSITYTAAEELIISFDAEPLRDNSRLRDTEISKYMTLMAVSGVTAKAKLRPIQDRWRVVEVVKVIPKPVPRSRRGYRSAMSTPIASPFGSPSSQRKRLSDPKVIPCTALVPTTPSSTVDSPGRKRLYSTDTTATSNNDSPKSNSKKLLLKRAMTFNDILIAMCSDGGVVSDDGSLDDEVSCPPGVDTKDVLSFAFYVPIYSANDTMIHGSGSVKDEIQLIRAYDEYNQSRVLKPITHKSSTTSKKMIKKKSSAVILRAAPLPPLDVYGTLRPPKVKSHGRKNKPGPTVPSELLSSTLKNVTKSYLSCDVLVGEPDSKFEIYKPNTLPKDYKLYNSARNINSW